MHELFAEVLSQKDLSKAGELFSLEDDAIEDDLGEIIQHIQKIADTKEYESNDNDQSIVEICITRITTAIRESKRIEHHAEPLVGLLSMCLRHNLTPKTKDEDPPHAKIASDVMSRLFSYYINKKVMTLAIPAVVKFLSCDNKDLVRSVASYLSLATIDNSSLLAQHMPLVLSSVLKGNYLLGQVLPQIYEQNSQPVLDHVDELAKLLSKCDSTEKICFLHLFNKVAKTHPQLLEQHVPQLCTYLSSSLHSPIVLMILVDMAMARPAAMVDQLSTIQGVVDSQPMLMYQVAQITGAVGTVSKEQAKKSMSYLVSKLMGMDQSILPAVLQEIRGLGMAHHSLLEENLDKISKLSSSGSSAVRLLVQQIREDVRKHNSATSSRKQSTSSEMSHSSRALPTHSEVASMKPKEVRSVSSQTEGTVTVITVGNPPNATHPSGTVSVKSTALPPSGASSQQSLAKIHRRVSLGDHSHSPAHTQTPEAISYTSVGTSTDNVNLVGLSSLHTDNSISAPISSLRSHKEDLSTVHELRSTSENPNPESVRDGVQLFCEKHFAKIKNFLLKLNATIPLPVKCSVVNGKHKRYLRLHFECANQSQQCLYSGSHFTLNTRLPKLCFGYDGLDEGPPSNSPPFLPERVPGLQLSELVTGNLLSQKRYQVSDPWFMLLKENGRSLGTFERETFSAASYCISDYKESQAHSRCALSQRDPDVSCLKACWDALKGDTTNSFLTLVTSSFPSQKDQLALLHELHQMRYFDVFELNAAREHWACFVCNHPEKLSELLNDGYPEIAGQLKEKKGKWKFFKRWKTRYFTLSGGSITYNKSNATKASLPVTKIQSVKAVRKGIRDTPKAFEIFTGDQTYRFKAKGHHNVEQWVQCLHIAVARSHSAGSASSSIPRALSVGSGAVSSGINGAASGGGGTRRASRRSSDRAAAYSGLFDAQTPSSMAANPPPTRRVVMDTKL